MMGTLKVHINDKDAHGDEVYTIYPLQFTLERPLVRTR